VKHANNFDLLRLLAAIDVLLTHATEHLKLSVGPWIGQIIISFPGVPIFFVISGFLITGTFFKDDGALAPYFRNRALRIYPAMWINLILISLMMLAFGVVTARTMFGPGFATWMSALLATGSSTIADPLVRHVPLLWGEQVQFSWNAQMPFWPGGALWTIIVELGFYAMVPLVFAGPLRRKRSLALMSLGFWAVASYVLDVYLRTHPSSLIGYASPFPYFWVFAIGAACNLAWPRIGVVFEGRAVLWMTLYIGTCVGLQYSTFGFHVPDYQQPDAITTALVVMLGGVALSLAFSFRWLSALLLRGNDISYGIYLHHMPILMLLVAYGWTGSLYSLPVLLGGTCLAAFASWKLVERPALLAKTPRSLTGASVPYAACHFSKSGD